MSWILLQFGAHRLGNARHYQPSRIIELESGDYVAGWRIDDVIPPDRLTRMRESWAQSMSAACAAPGVTGTVIDDNPERIWTTDQPTPAQAVGSWPKPEVFAEMVHWCREREKVRLGREAGLPAPWSDDPIIGGTFDGDGYYVPGGRFCNVRREDDVVTRWIAANIRKPYAEHKNLWLMLVIGRLINRPEALADLIAAPGAWPIDDDYDPTRSAAVIDDRIARRLPAWTAAYTIPAVGKDHPAAAWSKARQIFEIIVADLWARRTAFEAAFARGAGLADLHGMLTKAPQLGDFLAYQAVVDMRFTHLLSDAPDVESWAAAGPGTARGLCRLWGEPPETKMHPLYARRNLTLLHYMLRQELPDIHLDLSDICNACCEVDKYLRIKNGEGVMRAKYIPAELRDRLRPPAKRTKAAPVADEDSEAVEPKPNGHDQAYVHEGADDPRLAMLRALVGLGRQDRHARGYFDRAKGKFAYSHEDGPIGEAMLRAHVAGVQPLGMLVLPVGDRVRVAVLDLDDHDKSLGWDAMAAAGKRVAARAREAGMAAWPVRSGGGAGLHLWFAWNEPQSAAAMRAVLIEVIAAEGFVEGAGLGVAGGQIEIFPKAASCPEGAFAGGVVALPFARASVPLDDELQPVEAPASMWASAAVPEIAEEADVDDIDVEDAVDDHDANDVDPTLIPRLREALAAVPPLETADQAAESAEHLRAVRYGMALKRDLGDAGFALFLAWCKGHSKFKGEPSLRKWWDGFKPDGRVGVGTIFRDAQLAGDAAGNHGADEDTGPRAKEEKKSGRELVIVPFEEMLDPDLTNCTLVDGIVEAETIALAYGEPGCGKTFFVLDLALHIASGQEWHGRRVTGGRVVYVAAEAGRSIRNRVAAWAREKRPAGVPVAFAAVVSPVDLCHLGKGDDVERLIGAIGDDPVLLVVIDTVSRAMAGGNENTPEDMGAFVRALDLLKDRLRCTVIAVHHVGKDAGRGARGHSLLRGAIDTEIVVENREGVRVATILKQRDGAAGEEIAFRLKVVELGEDQFGKTKTTCIVEPEQFVPKRRGKAGPTGQAAVALELLRRAMIEKGEDVPELDQRGVKLDVWREYAVQDGRLGDGGKFRAAWHRAQLTLGEDGHVVFRDGWAWPADFGGVF